ncbi:two-component regulator propeller domain-containing protein [Dyadobacter sp. 676]|uniref:histidine kinase n=1 Tax=Dyadobacter sp. 676 TaxID=3088362 RepID=A0AAU8FFC9_9BACT
MKYSIRHYNSDNGLPQNSVRAIAQDSHGFLWLATDQGLVRFDGQTFVIFNKSVLGIRTNMFMSFLPDMEGRKDRFYVWTEEFDYIKVVAATATKEEPPAAARLRRMLETPEGGYGLFFSAGLPDRFHTKWSPLCQLFWLPGSDGSFFAWRPDGKVQLYTNWEKQKSYTTRIHSPRGFFRLGRNLYHDDETGKIELLATDLRSNARPGEITLTSAEGQTDKPNLAERYHVYSHDPSGNAFIAQGRKLYLLSEERPGIIATKLLIKDFDLERNNVSSIFFDRLRQRLYLGTLSNGLFILDFHGFETLTVDSDERESNVFYSQAAFSDSTVTTPSFRVLGKGPDGRIIVKTLPRQTKIVTSRYSMLKARSGDLWYTGNDSLYQFDHTGRQLKGRWTGGGEISHLYEDHTGRIWLGTKYYGLKYIDPGKNGASQRIFTRKITHISYMLREGKDVLWVATAAGLFKVNLVRNSISLIPRTDRYYIRSLLLERPGELWFTTYDDGVFLLRKNELTKLPLDKEHFLAHAHCIVRDGNDFFWIPTNQGLFRILRGDLLDFASHRDSTRLYYHHYVKQSGFHTNEFNGGCQPCAVRLSNGYVSLPSIDGLVFFKPEQIPLDVPNSEIFIDRIEADSRLIPVSSSKIELADANDIKVFVSSPYLGDRRNQQLYYMVSLEAKASSKHIWHPIENEHQSIHLNNLASGTYTLKLRKNGGFGRESQKLRSLTIVIPYAWYETWPFKIFLAILMLVMIYLYFKNRLKKADGLNKILESRVQERTLKLEDTLGVLKNSEQELLRQTRLQMHLIASISHDIRSPLRAIEFTSGKLPGLIQNGEYSLAETVSTGVNESSRRILTLLENMLSYVRSQLSDSSVVYETFTARDLVDEVAFIFKQAFAAQQNLFENNVPETLQVRSNRQLLKIILHNLIDNANKFSSEGSVAVSAGPKPGATTLIVSDTGIGLPDKTLNWFNESDAAYPESSGDEPKIHGIGLVIVKELAGILKLEIKANATSGAQFLITFPERD